MVGTDVYFRVTSGNWMKASRVVEFNVFQGSPLHCNYNFKKLFWLKLAILDTCEETSSVFENAMNVR